MEFEAVFMKKISILNPYNSSFFIYTDAGAWRENFTTNWPNQTLIALVHESLGNRVLLGQVKKFNKTSDRLDDPMCNLIEGGFFAGSLQAIREYESNFYEIHDERLNRGLFIGKDQTIMKILAFERNIQTVSRLRTWDYDCIKGVDEWFFYQYYFSNDNDYYCKTDRLSLISKDDK